MEDKFKFWWLHIKVINTFKFSNVSVGVLNDLTTGKTWKKLRPKCKMLLAVFSTNTWKIHQWTCGKFHKCTTVFKQQSGIPLLLWLMRTMTRQHVLCIWHCCMHHLSFLQQSHRWGIFFYLGMRKLMLREYQKLAPDNLVSDWSSFYINPK